MTSMLITCEISKAFDEVATLTRAIESSATRYAGGYEDANAAIGTLYDIIINQEDSPEGRGSASEARAALQALHAAIKLLIASIPGV
jgi:hypothetical protein